MRLWILSDLHLEAGLPALPAVQADVVVLAGDTAEGGLGLAWARRSFPDTPVVYVLGNHEYYGNVFPGLAEELKREAAGSHVHVLERDAVHIGGVEFLGCTLWTDQELWQSREASANVLEQTLNDHRRIRSQATGKALRAGEARATHAASRAWLEACCATAPERPRVIVTHHAPSPRSIPPAEWQALERDGMESEAGLRLLMRAGYASRLDPHVKASGAALWIHGHIHAPADYRIGVTRVLANPRGYGDQLQGRIQPGLVVELPVESRS